MKITQAVSLPPAGGAPGGAAGGDTSGTFPDPTVVGIQGTPVCVTAPLAGQLLVFDGSEWCPAFPSGGSTGTGTLTPGSITTITDDVYYNAWPSVARMTNGDLICVYTKAFTHHLDNSGNAVAKFSSDNGATWSAENSVYFDLVTPRWSSSAGVSVISTGRVFVTLWRDTWNVAGTGQAGIVYSDDFGVTWTPWIALTNSFTRVAFGAGPVVELPSGNLIVTIEGANLAQTEIQRSSHALFSSDGGATWGTETTIRNYVTDTRPYYETCLVRLANDDLLAVHRCATSAGLPHYISTSTDDGATWGAPVSEFAGYGQPHTILGSSGSLIAVTRRDSDAACIAYSSVNSGTSWSAAVALDATMYEMEYGCAIEITTGSYLVVYGSQPTSSTSNSDIKQIYLTETVTTTGEITVKDEGVNLTTALASLDFVGAGVTATAVGTAVTVTVPGGSFATPAIVLGTAAAAGAASTVIRSDSTIVAFDATVPASIGSANATGSVAFAAHRDHVHNYGTSSPYREVVMVSSSSPPDPVLNSDSTDWIYGSPV